MTHLAGPWGICGGGGDGSWLWQEGGVSWKTSIPSHHFSSGFLPPFCHANLTDEAGDLRGKAGISQIPLADLCSRVRN